MHVDREGRVTDDSLGMSDQARAVLALLSGREPDFAEYDKAEGHYLYESSTAAWYNGRERGFSLVVHRTLSDRTALVLTVTEHRVSDEITINHWVVDEARFVNPPTVADFPAEELIHQHRVPYGRVDKAVAFICERVGSFLTSRAAASA